VGLGAKAAGCGIPTTQKFTATVLPLLRSRGSLTVHRRLYWIGEDRREIKMRIVVSGIPVKFAAGDSGLVH
jgi:hypothetical protein